MIPACSFYSLKEVQGYMMLVCGVTFVGGGASGEPYLVATWSALWRHGVGTFGTVAMCLGMGTTVGGVVSVLRCCSDAPCHTWSCSQHDMFVLVV
jgi:hypothetical protein